MIPTHVTIPVNPLDMSEGAVEVEAYDAAIAYNAYYVRCRRELERLRLEMSLLERREPPPMWPCLVGGLIIGFIVGRL